MQPKKMNVDLRGGLAALALVVLTACGGGGSGSGSGSDTGPPVNPPAVVPVPAVTTVTPADATVGTLTTFTVAGSNLSHGMGFALADCSPSDTELAGGTATQRQFACTPQLPGTKAGAVAAAPGGMALLNFSVNARVIMGLTDTGITASQCYEEGSDVLVNCTSATAKALNDQQDGMVGHDVSAPDNADGKLGFSYSLVPNPAGGNFDLTECVKDKITGLTWESKTATGTRAGNNTYTNYDDTTAPQSFDHSVDSVGGTFNVYVNPTQAQIDATTNTVGYKNAVNASALCGYTDWRLPTTDELQSLVDYSAYPGLSIDGTWFPIPTQAWYWSASANASMEYRAGSVDFPEGNISYNADRNYRYAVRLVR